MALQNDELYWHESAGARILLPLNFVIRQPFPELSANVQDSVAWIIVTVASNPRQRRHTEELLRLPSQGGGPLDIATIHDRPVSGHYHGRELVLQITNPARAVTTYELRRILDLDQADTYASFRVIGIGLFREVESLWETILDSFSWDPSIGVALKFDGDEIDFRSRYRALPMRVPAPPAGPLPAELGYLQPAMDDFLRLPTEELHEDTDTSLALRLVQHRIQGLAAEKARSQLRADRDALRAWNKENPAGAQAGEFLAGFIDGFIMYDLGN